MFKKWATKLLAVALIIASASVVTMTTQKLHSQNSLILPGGYHMGVWDWHAPDTTSHAAKQQLAASLAQAGVTDVYVDVTDYTDAMQLPNGTARTAKISAITASLRDQASILHEYGIHTHALAGNTSWADPDNTSLPLALMQFAHDFNQSASAEQQLAGIQFDIEFYNDPGFYDDPQTNSDNFVSLAQQLTTKYTQLFGTTNTFSLGLTLPDWLDGTNPAIPKTPKPVAYRVIDALGHASKSYVALMAYRRQTATSDGSIAHAQNELAYAQNSHSPIGILIGQETTDVQPAKITFYGQSKPQLVTAINQIASAFKNNPNFAGFAFNDSDGITKLKD